ncbi:cation diffusion facilitator family transporter [Bacteroides gallinaceum]|uniref:cation diffusion facilitator family transporter n=1 Tax=Bacteroides gallinaceum TaxID=1462571 RepID=UPI0025A32527|nr:cation diffusion facilitator family transporter [Bacteroides gallinaceum]MDM8154584.1 cation diffusion facilitator family transporter [Bacteroides gallinaceum]
MSHSHVHEHNHTLTSLNSIFIVCIIINLLFVIIEAGAGFIFNSLGLLSDAGHNLSDVFSLLLSLFAFRMSKHRSTEHFTYGYKKSTVLVSLLNAIILLIAVGAIIIESIYKLKQPEQVSGAAVSWTAGIGILVNGVTAWLLMKNQKHDLNVRGAFLHMAMDTLVSVGVVISGIIIMLTGFVLIDTFISLVIALLILASTWKLLKESLFLSLDAVPEGIDMQEAGKHIAQVPGVESFHHFHVWAMSTTENAATIHIVLKELSQMEEVKHAVKEELRKHGIHHSTVECETPGSHCEDTCCCK